MMGELAIEFQFARVDPEVHTPPTMQSVTMATSQEGRESTNLNIL